MVKFQLYFSVYLWIFCHLTLLHKLYTQFLNNLDTSRDPYTLRHKTYIGHKGKMYKLHFIKITIFFIQRILIKESKGKPRWRQLQHIYLTKKWGPDIKRTSLVRGKVNDPTEKQMKNLNRHFMKKNIQTSNKYK